MPRPHSEVARKSQGPPGNSSPRCRRPRGIRRKTCLKRRQARPPPKGWGILRPPHHHPLRRLRRRHYPGARGAGDRAGSPAESAGAISPPTPGQGNAGPSIRDEDLAKTDERTDQAAVPPTPSEELVPVVTGRGRKTPFPVLQDELTDEKGLQETEKEPLPARTGARAAKPAKKKKKTSPAPAKTTAPPESSPEYAYPALSEPGGRGDVSREDPARLRLIIRGRPTFRGCPLPGAGNRSGYLTGSFSGYSSLPFPTRYQRLPVRTPAGQPPAPQPEKIPVMVFAAVAIVLLIIIGAAAITFLYPAGNPTGPVDPVITPTLTPLPVTTIPATVIPLQGVWVKVTYNGTFIGSYGNPGPANQHEVQGNRRAGLSDNEQ